MSQATEAASETGPVGAASPGAGDQPERVFSQSILVSAVRCTLSYVVFPFIAPIVGIASGIGSAIGLIIGTIAIASNVWSIWRFHASDHRYKWPVSALNAGIIVLLIILFVVDLGNLS